MKKKYPRLRDNIEAIAVNMACRAGYHDPGLDFSPQGYQPQISLQVQRFLPPSATHYFFVQVDGLRYLVTRYEDRWSVDFDDKTAAQKRERSLRQGALSAALHHFAAELSYPLEVGGEDDFIKKLLNEGLHPELQGEAPWKASLTGHHPIVRDEPSEAGEPRWLLQVGSHRCLVGLEDRPEPVFVIL